MSAAERAAAGAALLDEKRPGWSEAIDCAMLDIATGRHCVLGQLYGTYGDGLSKLSITAPGQYGFAVSAERELMNEAWREEIARRRLANVPVAETDEVGLEAYC